MIFTAIIIFKKINIPAPSSQLIMKIVNDVHPTANNVHPSVNNVHPLVNNVHHQSPNNGHPSHNNFHPSQPNHPNCNHPTNPTHVNQPDSDCAPRRLAQRMENLKVTSTPGVIVVRQPNGPDPSGTKGFSTSNAVSNARTNARR